MTVQCWGGGGGGGTPGLGYSGAGGGGGGGAYAFNTYAALLSGTYDYTIGLGGAGGWGGSGRDGGSTIWNFRGAQDIYVTGGGGGSQDTPGPGVTGGTAGLVVAGAGYQGGAGGRRGVALFGSYRIG